MPKTVIVAVNQPADEVINRAISRGGGPTKAEVVSCNSASDLRRLQCVTGIFIVGKANKITPKQFADWLRAWRLGSPTGSIKYWESEDHAFSSQVNQLLGK